jgi:MFS family permease
VTGPATADLRLASAAGRGVLLAAVLASGMAFLDATIVNVALPRVGAELDATLSGLQWTVSAYTLTLAAFVLLGGALGDRFGRRRVFLLGVVWFTVASLLCGLAQSVEWLVVARAVQGIGAALLTPGSLALMQASFHPDDRGRAVGAWSGLSGVSTAIGPFVGGWLIDAFSWRWIFFLNLPLAAAVLSAARAGGLLAVAALPLLVGLSGTAYRDPGELTGGYRAAKLWCVGLLLSGAAIAAVFVPRHAPLSAAASQSTGD